MKAEQFSQSLNQINDKYLEEAATYGNSALSQQSIPSNAAGSNGTGTKPFRTMKIWRAVAIAACALLAVGIGITAIGLSSERKGSYAEAPALGGGAAAYSEGTTGNYAADSDSFGDNYLMEDAGAGAYEDSYEEYAPEPAKEAPLSDTSSNELKTGSAGSITATMPADENAKIIYTAYMTVETTEFEQSQEQLTALTNAHGGYFESMDQENSDSYRNAYYEIRIPADKFDAFMKETEGIGTIVSVTQNALDITENYTDIESRLETEKAKLARLQELLSQAQDMSDMITIENEIANVQWTIDDLSGTLKHYDSQISYSTVSVSLHEVYRISDPDAPLSFGERISKSFSSGISGFAEGMEDFLVWLAAGWLWILLVAVVVAAVVIIIVKVTKKNRK